MRAAFLSSSEPTGWSDVEMLQVGGSHDATSIVAQVAISMESGRRLRVDIQSGAGYSCFQDVCCVGGIAYIGYGECLFVVQPNEQKIETHSLTGYFGHLYSAEALGVLPQMFAVLVASASELLCFSLEGRLLWRTTDLAIDGVVVESVQGGVVRGSGEWDPPGGWKPFCVSASTGEKNVA